MTEPPDNLERRFGERFEAYLRDGVGHVDARSVGRRVAETSRQPRMTRPRAAALVAATVIAAAVLTVSAQRLIPASSSATPIPSLTPGPSASANLGAPAIDEAGTFVGGGLWARHSGDLYLSTDGGASWSRGTIQPDPAAVFVLDAKHAWTVSLGPGSTGNTSNPGQDVVHYLVSHTTDGGGSWQVVTLAGNYPESGPALSFANAERGYLLIAPERFSNATATVFATSDGGASWQQVGTGGSTQLLYARMFSATPDGTLWAGAEATATGAGSWGLLQVSRDGGVSWQSVRLPGLDTLSNGDYLLAPPTVIGSTVIVAVSRVDNTIVYRSADGGRSWQASAPLGFGLAYGVPAILDTTHWLVPAPTGLTIWVTDDAGASWRQATTSGLPGIGPIFGLSFADDQHGAALVSLGNSPAPNGLFVTADGGQSWRPAPLPAAAPTPSPKPGTELLQVDALAFWSGGQIGLVGGAEGASGRVDRTTDGGNTWTTVWRPDAPVAQLAAFGTADALAVTCASSDADCMLWQSADGGTAWSAMGSTPAAVSFSDPQHGWRLVPEAPPPGTAVGGPGAATIERSGDGGLTWQSVAAGPCGPGRPSGMGPIVIAAQSAASAWLLCTGGPATIMEDKTLAVTSDGGVTWEVRAVTIGSDPSRDVGQIPISGHPSGLAIAPDGTAWMWGGRMPLLVSRDGGRTWSALALGEIDVSSVTAAAPLDSRNGFALLWDPNSQASLLEVTGDGGASWSTRFSWPINEPNASPTP